MPSGDRPQVDTTLSAGDLARWYWTLAELRHLAHLHEVRATGSKALLEQRLTAALSNSPFQEPPSRRPAEAPLPSTLTSLTVIPVGQRCTQQLRQWFIQHTGPGFRFDATMRSFISCSDGTATLGDALQYWRDTRNTPTEVIPGQFEYNRFTRAWHAEHPGGSRAALLRAWHDYRSRPVEDRGRA